MEVGAAEIVRDESGSLPSQAVEEEELLGVMSGALQHFLDRGDPELVETFLLSFFHRVGKAAGLKAEGLIAEFTGDRTPLREIADAKGCSIPTAWRRLGAALEILQDGLRAVALTPKTDQDGSYQPEASTREPHPSLALRAGKAGRRIGQEVEIIPASPSPSSSRCSAPAPPRRSHAPGRTS